MNRATDATGYAGLFQIRNNQKALKVQKQGWCKALVMLCAIMTIAMMFPSVLFAQTAKGEDTSLVANSDVWTENKTAATVPDKSSVGFSFANADPDLPVTIAAGDTIDVSYDQTYTVTFIGKTNNVLSIQTVKEGGRATAPTNLGVSGYTFTGWDRDFSNISSDLIVQARYLPKAVSPVIFIVPEAPPVTATPIIITNPTTTAATTPLVISSPTAEASNSDESATATILAAATPTAAPSAFVSSSATVVMDPDVVLIHGTRGSAWAVLNIILTVAGLLCATSLTISYLVQCKQNEEEEKNYYCDRKNAAKRQYKDYIGTPTKRLWPRIVNVVLALVALMLFVIAENTAMPMVWWDQWTIWHTVIFAVIVVLTIVAIITKKFKNKDRQEPQQSSQNGSVAQM